MITQERALDALSHQELLAQTYELERDMMERIVTLALDDHPGGSRRWHEYEVLKRLASRIVGFDARRPELRTPGHYEVLLAFVDWLLPKEEP